MPTNGRIDLSATVTQEEATVSGDMITWGTARGEELLVVTPDRARPKA
jgi:hypothetical protein